MRNLSSQKPMAFNQIVIFVYMEVNNELVNNLSELARLQFNEQEKLAVKNDLQRMISFLEKLKEVDTANTEPLLHMGHAWNVYRKDEVKGSMNRATALNNAPGADNEYLKVPKVIKK
jgi:aspartyl-tRNA(Asn)/glutamyl-tRNA(Gln) amidotransferase subunit C